MKTCPHCGMRNVMREGDEVFCLSCGWREGHNESGANMSGWNKVDGATGHVTGYGHWALADAQYRGKHA